MRMKKQIQILAPILTLLATNAVATPQVPDVLCYRTQTHLIHPSPLTDYILDAMQDWSFDQMQSWDTNLTMSTACYRGFVAEWEIRDDKLFLLSLRRPHAWLDEERDPEIHLSALNSSWKAPVHADWFSGVLYEFKWRIWYVHPSLIGGHYLARREFQIENGRLVSTVLLFPWVGPCIPYLAVLLPGIGLLVFLRIRRRRAHNKAIQVIAAERGKT